MHQSPLPRLDLSAELCKLLLPYCRLNPGEIWIDGENGHRVGCIDAADSSQVLKLCSGEKAQLAVHDPPYNLAVFEIQTADSFAAWCREWLLNSTQVMKDDANLFLWLGASQNEHFQPLPEVMMMMRELPWQSRSFITMRNQRGYGTQKNFMAVRQELLYYTRGKAYFDVEAEYTDIPKILRGYYKDVGGERTDNLGRSKSPNIRAGNVWVDVQQVFYRMEENVSGCFAQKPLKSQQRILQACSATGEIVLDFFAHAGTTLIAAEKLGRRCFTCDIDPIFSEITIRRLEHLRETGKTGWQAGNPFEKEIAEHPEIQAEITRLSDKYQPEE